jgi:glyoxylase-like metal-dependent hydrolase (beta-lactamase superfamily II)
MKAAINAELEVLHTPGHTNDSLVLFDRENRALFTGDTFYPDSLFAFMEDEWGQSNLSVFDTGSIDMISNFETNSISIPIVVS